MQIPGTEKVIPVFRYMCLLGVLAALPGLAEADIADDYKRGLESYRGGDIVSAMTTLKAPADAGHAPSQALYGVILDSAEFDEEAVGYLQKAAAQNDPDGQYGLAKMYIAGEGVPRDQAEAGRLLRLAAQQGHERAIISLALAYVSGNAAMGAGNPENPEAAPLLLKAAEFGEVTVMETVAKAYRQGGFGLSPDAARAAEWEARLVKIRGIDTRTGGRRR